ncbi:MAG: hypothetical protein PVG71_15175, partial [Anaerolineae bacterium]
MERQPSCLWHAPDYRREGRRCEVVTSLIRADSPARVASNLASAIASRVILDMGSAEQLRSRGYILYSRMPSKH